MIVIMIVNKRRNSVWLDEDGFNSELESKMAIVDYESLRVMRVPCKLSIIHLQHAAQICITANSCLRALGKRLRGGNSMVSAYSSRVRRVPYPTNDTVNW